jgi:hypothetical protein
MTITYRSPQLSDVDKLLEYINTLSSEQTFLTMQGKQLTKAEELSYLKSFLKDIKNKTAVKVFAFDNETLIGAADVKVGVGVIKHVGVFADNERAAHLYKKFGFKEYGVLPNGVMRKGVYTDHIDMYLRVKD